MRLAAYLCTSRHGIFYFRFPLPVAAHPAKKRGYIKLSLETRTPCDARYLARLLAAAGQSALARPSVRAMRYDEMREHVREHFGQLLSQFRERIAADGPASAMEINALKASQTLADGDVCDWLSLTRYDDDGALLRAFCERRGIANVPKGEAASRLAHELQKGYREYAARALRHSAQFDTLPLIEANVSAAHHGVILAQSPSAAHDVLSFAEVQARYFEEMQRNTALAVKTEADKEDALALLAELTHGKPPVEITKTDAREVKAAIFKLLKNRSKNPKTRDLPLREMLELSDVERLSTTTMNRYLGHMQTFFAWAVKVVSRHVV